MQSLQSTPVRETPDVALSGPHELLLSRLCELLPKLRDMTTSISQENCILQRLKFSTIYTREDSIQDATNGTFAWIVQKDGGETERQLESNLLFSRNYDEGNIREKTRKPFLTWLNSGHHIFHISGKAGAGKSTMMKFLGQSPRVRGELQLWAGNKPLIFALFYFCVSGDNFQRSLEGLYRGLLFETFQQYPGLLPRAFSEIGNDLKSDAPQSPFRFNEVEAAFIRLIKDISLTHRTCFLVDGLDEFEGDEVDHWRMARNIQSWTNSENVKFCVSSRPYVPFLHSFGAHKDTQIHIHHLTRGDIRRFSLSMFETDPNFDRINHSYKHLSNEVGTMSNGVFLWARLVVRSLLKGVGYRVTQEELKRKLYFGPFVPRAFGSHT